MPDSPAPSAPWDPAAVDLAHRCRRGAAVYVHVPFCRRVCPYCDFVVVAGREDAMGRYVAALESEIAGAEAWQPLDSIFIGGGTPSRLDATQVGRIVRALEAKYGLRPGAEISIEANPEDWTAEYAAQLVDLGFNRVSFGIQSFDPVVLDSLGRLHTAEQARVVVGEARDAGFRSISIDLIFGTPGESEASWRTTVEAALRLEPDHVSTYALTVERGTALSRAVSRGAPAPDEDDQAEKYLAAERMLEGAGLARYETSNYARPGHACVYNLITWCQGDYLAFGAGAHGHRRPVRYRNLARLEAYLRAIESGDSCRQGSERIEGWAREQERLILGLRLAAGVEAGEGGKRLERDAWGRRLIAAGVLGRSGERLRVLRPLLGDEVARAVLALSPGEC